MIFLFYSIYHKITITIMDIFLFFFLFKKTGEKLIKSYYINLLYEFFVFI